jgi:3-oxoacyl-[acyl-carrier-protein] synthase I
VHHFEARSVMRRVVVTGMGIVSSIGNTKAEVLRSLRESRSGLEFFPEMAELGFKCCVAGRIKQFDTSRVSKRAKLTMSAVAQYAALAALEAIEDARLPPEALESPRVGVVVGTPFGGITEVAKAEELLSRYRNPSRLGGTGLVKTQHSTASGNLASWLGVQGRAYSICSSFCAGVDNIGHAYELVTRGILDLCIAGASEESSWKQLGAFFDNWGGMPSSWNDQPEKACRPYDRDREGMVVTQGAGILILETMERAVQRGVDPYAEIVGYGSANDGFDMFHPSGEGLRACLRQALAMAEKQGVQQIDYINSHGTGTKVHDPLEVKVIREIFNTPSPFVSSTKALAGHSLGAAGAQEAIFTLLMMRHGFIAPTVNLEHISSDCMGISHVQSLMEIPLRSAITFNAGLGGTNASLIFHKL